MPAEELTRGNPYKLILKFMFPIYLGNVFQQLYSLVDGLIVGRILGLNALAAVGATMPLVFLFISFVYAATQGFTVITAQRFGAGDYTNVRKSFAASLILSTILTVILTILSAPLTKTLLQLLKTPEEILDSATIYLFILLIGIFATVFYNLASNIIRALGDSKTPLYFLIFSALLNIILDLIFVLKFKMGVPGTAWATVLAELIATFLCIGYMLWKFPILRLKKSDWELTNDFIYEHLRIGIPMGIQMSVLSLGIILVQYVLNILGAIYIVAFTTAMRIEQMFTQIYLAIGATMAVYTAQNYGANNMPRIRQGARAAVVITVVATLISIICISIFSTEMVQVFLNEVNIEVIALAKKYLFINMFFFIFLGLLLIYRNLLQGIGLVTAPLISGFAELITRGGAAFVLGIPFAFTGICYTGPVAWISATIVLYIGYKINLHKMLNKQL